jgi:hypothetical protein
MKLCSGMWKEEGACAADRIGLGTRILAVVGQNTSAAMRTRGRVAAVRWMTDRFATTGLRLVPVVITAWRKQPQRSRRRSLHMAAPLRIAVICAPRLPNLSRP